MALSGRAQDFIMADLRIVFNILLLALSFGEITPKEESEALAVKGMDCSDIWQRDHSFKSGVYLIQPDGAPRAFQVYCEMTESGGWTVLQKRNGYDGVDFRRCWDEYEQGFGIITGEHWIGLKLMSFLTHQKRRHCKLRINLEDFSGHVAHAEYGSFRVDHDNYTLCVTDYSGTAGDGFKGNSRPENDQNGSAFSTEDNPNDECQPECQVGDIMFPSCSSRFQAGWWFKSCGGANLNGIFRKAPRHKYYASSVSWPTWKENESLKYSQMSIHCC